MDLAQDILRIAEKVAQVPGLSAACTLAMTIIKTVQISKNNTARLQYLAHLVAENLVSLADHMHGRWDNISGQMRMRLDEFEAVLRDVSKLVTKYSKSSRVLAFVNASDRDSDITRIEKRLADVQRSLLIVLGVDTSVVVHNLQTAVGSQHPLLLETHSTVQQILTLNLSQRTALEEPSGEATSALPSSFQDSDEPDLRRYTRRDLRLVRKIGNLKYYGDARKNLTITLHEAQHCADGRVVLVKSYEGSDPRIKEKTFSRDLSSYANAWDSSILQLVGASGSTSRLPFHVYDAPSGQLEDFPDWFLRTLKLHPVETLLGLYEMRTSLKALVEFQSSRSAGCWDPFFNSVVNVRSDGNRQRWALIYTGEIEGYRPSRSYTVIDEYHDIPNRLDAPAWRVAESFANGSKAWMDGAPALDAFLDHSIQNVNLTTLYSTLFENGWLSTCVDFLVPSTTVGLGDVGYTTEDGRFITVTNLHSLLTSVDGSAPSWVAKSHNSPNPYSDDTVELKHSGQSYKRYKNQKSSSYYYNLGYTGLDGRRAWEVLQAHARSITARHAPATSPYELKLVTSIDHYGDFGLKGPSESEDEVFELDNEPEDGLSGHFSVGTETLGIQDADNAVSRSDKETDLEPDTSGRHSSLYSSSYPPSQLVPWPLSPPFYVFEGDVLHVRDSGVPELSSSFRTSFQEEPDWLDDENSIIADRESVQDELIGTEMKDGFELIESRICLIKVLQVPEGVALLRVEELDSS